MQQQTDVTPEQLRQLEEMKKTVIKKILSRDAIERLGRIRVVKPDLATQLELYLLQLYQGGKVKSEITDSQLKTFLDAISSRHEFNIMR